MILLLCFKPSSCQDDCDSGMPARDESPTPIDQSKRKTARLKRVATENMNMSNALPGLLRAFSVLGAVVSGQECLFF